jgi:ribosomal protein S18 acetylase RimI-like enzyme
MPRKKSDRDPNTLPALQLLREAVGLTQIELIVWEFNKGAIAFYEQLGCETAYRQMRKSLP